MKAILTDEMLEFYAGEYLIAKDDGLLDGMTFEEYLNIKTEVINININRLKGENKNGKKQKKQKA